MAVLSVPLKPHQRGGQSKLLRIKRLKAWWLRLGIGIGRIKPGHPEQNGRHERMHLTLKREATKPASPNFLQQQARFDAFVACYNDERPHEALDMRVPADDYAHSPRRYRGISELEYPFHDWTAIVTTCGRICYENRKVNLSTVFAGQKVGVAQVSSTSGSSASWTMTWDTLMTRHARSSRSRIPFGRKCYPCLRNELLPMSPEWT
jgi:putative transposase